MKESGNHPIWHTVHVVVVILAVGAVFLMNASTPDMTEIMGALQSAPLVGASQYVLYRRLRHKSGGCSLPACPLKDRS